MKIVIPDKINLDGDAKSQIEELGGVTIYDDVVNEEDVIIDRIREAEIITANYIELQQR